MIKNGMNGIKEQFQFLKLDIKNNITKNSNEKFN